MIDEIDIVSGKLRDAVVDPASWGQALDSINEFVDGSGAVVLSVNERLRHAPSSSDLAEMMDDYISNGWHAADQREGCVPLLLKRGIVFDHEFQDIEQMERSEYYNDFLARHGRKWFAGIAANVDGDLWCLALQRSPAKGPFVDADLPRLRAIRTRFAESALVARAMSLSRLAGQFEAFELLDRAAMILDSAGRIIEMSSAARKTFGSSVSQLRDLSAHIAHLYPILNGLPRDEPSHVTSKPAHRFAATIGRRSYTLDAVRLFDRSGQTFSKASFLLLAVPRKSDPAVVLKKDYGLTAAEARVAMALASGSTVGDIADLCQVAPNTVRMHLKAAYAKTDTGTQSKLVAFISDISNT